MSPSGWKFAVLLVGCGRPVRGQSGGPVRSMDAQGDKAILSLPRDSRSPKETVVSSPLAHIAEPIETADRRRMRRRTLRLDVAARSATSEAAVVIRNLSRTGLLIETDAAF